MKALSLRQPWAWLVVHGGKAIENRVWNTSFRGDFLIHAAKGMTKAEYISARNFAAAIDLRFLERVPAPEDLPRGGVVGKALLVDVLRPCTIPQNSLFNASPCRHPWHMPEQYGFVLANVSELPFRPMKGMLGFFEAP